MDPIAEKARTAFLNDRRTMELIEQELGANNEHVRQLKTLWIGQDPPPITAEEHGLFLSVAVRALAEIVAERTA